LGRYLLLFFFFITPDKGSTQRTQPAKNTKHQYKYKKESRDTVIPVGCRAAAQQSGQTEQYTQVYD